MLKAVKSNEKYRNGVSERGRLLKLLEKFEGRPLSEEERRVLERGRRPFSSLRTRITKNMESMRLAGFGKKESTFSVFESRDEVSSVLVTLH